MNVQRYYWSFRILAHASVGRCSVRRLNHYPFPNFSRWNPSSAQLSRTVEFILVLTAWRLEMRREKIDQGFPRAGVVQTIFANFCVGLRIFHFQFQACFSAFCSNSFHKDRALKQIIFSRSYCCYTAWSAIGVILLSVCRPSVRLSVTLCIVALRVGVRG